MGKGVMNNAPHVKVVVEATLKDETKGASLEPMAEEAMART